MAFINCSVLMTILMSGAVAIDVVLVMTSVVDVGTMGGNVVISVEGAVVTVGTTSGGWEVDSPCFSCRAFSNDFSISLNPLSE